MSEFFGQIGGAKARGPGYEYLGPGKYVLELVELKVGSAFIAEFKVVEAAPYRGMNPENEAGTAASWYVSITGTKKKEEMGLADAKGFMVALVTSLGQDPAHISNAAWEGIGAKVCGREQMARGVLVNAVVWRETNKLTGQLYAIPKVRFTSVPGQAPRPGIFQVYGAPPAPAPKPPAQTAAPSQSVREQLMHKLRDAMITRKEKGETLGQLMDSAGELFQRAAKAGVSADEYNAELERIFAPPSATQPPDDWAKSGWTF
jgi:hypothetical protein